LKILHVSDDPLPDARVEKMAYLSKKRDRKTFFAGPGFNSFALGGNVFDNLYFVPWNRYVRLGIPPYFQRVKRKLEKIINTVKPDVIHAHDLFAAKIVCDLGHPFVFDDHELTSLESKSYVEWKHNDLFDRTVGKYKVWMWGRWEREVSSRAPVVTVSHGVADFYAKFGAKVFVVPNYPSLFELSKAKFCSEKDETFTTVYLGKDVSKTFQPFRDVSGLTDVFKNTGLRLIVVGDTNLASDGRAIVSKGYVPHLRIYPLFSRYHVGLVPWKKHWLHEYADPNKPYIYAHSNMVVIVTSSLENVINAFGSRCRTIEDYSDLQGILVELSQDVDSAVKEGERNKEYAQHEFIFERYESQVVEAYKKAC